MELNPNHPTTRAISDHWHKIAAIMMHKLGVTHVHITEDDLRTLPADMFMVAHDRRDGLHIRFVDSQTAHRLAREHGGLPS